MQRTIVYLIPAIHVSVCCTMDSGNSYLGVKRFRELVDKNKSPGQMQAFAVLSQTDLRDSDLRDFQR